MLCYVGVKLIKLFNQQKVYILFLKEKQTLLQNWLVILGIPKDIASSNIFISFIFEILLVLVLNFERSQMEEFLICFYIVILRILWAPLHDEF